jgi:hypothetical protein
MTDTTHLRKLTDEVEAKFGDAGRVAVEPKAMRELLDTIDRLQLDKVRDALVIENLHSTIANLTADRDSWADQCERRVQDVLRVAAERDALMVGASEMAAIEAQEPVAKIADGMGDLGGLCSIVFLAHGERPLVSGDKLYLAAGAKEKP